VAAFLNAAVRLLDTLNAPIARWGRSLSAVLLALMFCVALAQIVSRAVFGYTLDWAEESARIALVWSVLLAAPIAYRCGAHVAITAFAEALPQRWLLAVALLVNALVAWICVVFLLESFALVERGLTIVGSAVPIRMAWVYSIVPVALTALALVALEAIVHILRAMRDPSVELPLAGVVPILQRGLED
jgi:TRAP-type C4-dicarboxylate transport system permease small subunit